MSLFVKCFGDNFYGPTKEKDVQLMLKHTMILVAVAEIKLLNIRATRMMSA